MILALLMLNWYLQAPAYIPEQIVIMQVSDLNELRVLCLPVTRSPVGACAIRETGVCKVYLGPWNERDLNCQLRHELKHCAGWNHVNETHDCH